jgi:hypothetical protein
MELIMTAAEYYFDEITEEESLVRSWRIEQLGRLGLSHAVAETYADVIDWHEFAELVDRGCSPDLALEIVR